jgi:hypothetical protein
MLTLVCKLELAECVVNFGARYEEVMVRSPDLCTPLTEPIPRSWYLGTRQLRKRLLPRLWKSVTVRGGQIGALHHKVHIYNTSHRASARLCSA